MFHLVLAVVLLLFACCAVLQAPLSGFAKICPFNRFRPPVKWTGGDVFLIFALYIFNILLCARILAATGYFDLSPPADVAPMPDTVVAQADEPDATGEPGSPKTAVPKADEQARQHPIARLFKRGKETPALLLLGLLLAVVAAPLVEEFLFRFLLQGWLGNLERRLRRRDFLHCSRNFRGLLPVVGVAFLFALIHLRGPGREGESLDPLVFSLLAMLAASALTLIYALLYLVTVRKMRLRDFGIDLARVPRDIATGLLCFVLILPPMICVTITVNTLLPNNLVDPFPLFVFALALGVLYFRTGRIVASLTMHVALNLFSSLLALAA